MDRYRLPSGRDGRTMYDAEPWAKLAREAGFEPFDTESSARSAFSFCAEKIADYDRAFADGKRNGALKSILSSLRLLRLRMLAEVDEIAEALQRNPR